jgi:hypothetical protein
MNIRMTIPKNRDSSGTAILYIVGTSVFISSGQRSVSAAAAHDRTSRRRLQTVVGPRGLNGLVQSLGCDVRAVGPHHGAPVEKKPAEVGQSLERLEHRATEPLLKVDSTFRAIVKDEMNSKSTSMLGVHNRG